ncbi:MAG: hypothetical protein ACK5Q5_11460 [Planctomycetaceae bacterium]
MRRTVASSHRQIGLARLTIAALAAFQCTEYGAVLLRAEESAPSKQDVDDLVHHVREYPPRTYDIEVISEYALKPATAESLRASVESIYNKTDDAASSRETPAERSQQIDREVQRLLAEQTRPRRVRKRCRFSEHLGYRLDMVIERIGSGGRLDTGPVEQAPFKESFVNVGSAASGDSRSVTIRHRESLAALKSQPGARVVNDHVWTGGTVGWPTLLLVKSALSIGKPDEAKQIEKLLSGLHPNISLSVDRGIALPDGMTGRRFHIQVEAGGKSIVVDLDVPATSFNPVWKVAYPQSVPREVLIAKDGVAQVWIERDVGTPAGGVKYTLVSRGIDVEVDPDVFAFKVPDGFNYVDYTVDPPKIVYADGRIEVGQRTPLPPVPGVVGSRWKWLMIGNILMVFGLFVVVFARRRMLVQRDHPDIKLP